MKHLSNSRHCTQPD